MTLEAQVRAPLTKAILELLDRQPGNVAQAVRARVPNEVRRVEECSRVDWIPLSVQLAILDALREGVGTRRWEEFVCTHFSTTIEQPFVKGMFEAAVRIFGMGPGAVFRVFAKTWATISKGCGEVEIGEVDPSGTLITVRKLPVEQLRIELFVLGFRSTFQGVIDVFKRAGVVELVSWDRGTRTSVYRAKWG